MNIFNGRLDLFAITPVDGSSTQWDIAGTFVDNSGSFYATDAAVGDIIYQDGTSQNNGIQRYQILSIDVGQTDFNNLYVRVQWEAYSTVKSPLIGFDTCIGRAIGGYVYLPSASMQELAPAFLDYIRNTEGIRASQASFNNRVYNGAYTGDRDGFNQVFQINEPFIVETLDVFVNGILQGKGDPEGDFNDYILLGDDQVQFTITPTLKDILTFNYNKKQ